MNFGIDWMTLGFGVFIGLMIGNSKLRSGVMQMLQGKKAPPPPLKTTVGKTPAEKPTGSWVWKENNK